MPTNAVSEPAGATAPTYMYDIQRDQYSGYNWSSSSQYCPWLTAGTPASSAPSTPPQLNHQCLMCPTAPTFSTSKDLVRHQKTSKAHWTESTQFYRCRCGISQTRKDNHLRHVQNCDAQPCNAYGCKCKAETEVQDDHIKHVEGCGRRRRRGPRQTAA
ncbi:hypothetical protein F5Y14DRAFT_434636 [Nemania sp. NC0429]|nr:hypothetical protein F5Y14DRAFT_434636 [Nemania sp. NC0429]